MKAEQTMNAFHRQLNARKKKLGTKTEEKLGKVRNWVAVATRPERVGPAFGSFQRFRHRRHRKKKKNVIAFKEIISVGHVGSTSFIRVLVVFAARFRRY